MTTTAGTDPAAGNLKCMGVWGGNGATNNYLSRPGLDVWIWSQSQSAAETGGGDVYLLSSCASGRITRTLVADVCARTPLFEEIAGEMRDLVKRNVNSIQQVRCVRQMNRQLEEVSQRGGFASTLVSTYFAPTRSFAVCNAGHPPPFLFQAKSGTWSILKQIPSKTTSANTTPGVVGQDEYQQFKIKLAVGDMVLTCSDLLTECHSDRAGGMIGLDGLLDRVRQLDPQQPRQLTTRLVNQLRNERSGNLATADATVLLYRATATRVGWWDNLLAPFRLLRSVTDQTQIG